VLAHPPREEQVAPRRLARPPADDLHALAVVDVRVTVLHEQAAEDAPVVALARVTAAALAVVEDPGGRFLPQHRQRLVVEPRREQHLDELTAEPRAEPRRDSSVEDD